MEKGFCKKSEFGLTTTRHKRSTDNLVSMTGQIIGKNILIVEDDMFLNAILGRYFKKIGYQPFLAHTAREAKTILGHRKVEMALIDYSLPDSNGIEMLDYVRQYLLFEPVFIITGSLDHKLPVEAQQHGANGFVAKPFSAQALHNLILPYIEAIETQPEMRKEFLYATACA